MATVYLFGDEAGNFDFSEGPGATRHFILVTVTMNNCQAGDRIQALRRRLAWRGVHLGAVLHASEDPQPVRDEVFRTLQRSKIPDRRDGRRQAFPVRRDTRRPPALPLRLAPALRSYRRRDSQSRRPSARRGIGSGDPQAQRCVPSRRRRRGTRLGALSASRGVLAEHERAMPRRGRLLHVGDPTQVGARRHAVTRADRRQDRLRDTGRPGPKHDREKLRPPSASCSRSRARGLFRR